MNADALKGSNVDATEAKVKGHHDQLTPQEAQEIIAALVTQRDAAIEHIERLLSGGQGWPWHEKDAEAARAFVDEQAASKSTAISAQLDDLYPKYDRVVRALRELVACKDLKERIIELAVPHAPDTPELSAINAEYKHRQPHAWAAARHVLSAINPKG